MTLFSDNVNLLAETLPRKRLRGVTGILDTNGQVNPNPTDGLDTGFTWCRLQGERTAIAVINVTVTNQVANVAVILEESDTGQYEIIGIDAQNAIYTHGRAAIAMNKPDVIPELEKGSIPHKRIKDLRIRLSEAGGLTLTIEGGYFEKKNGDLVYKVIGDIDLAASAVSTEDYKRPVIIGITDAGVPVQYAGTEIVTGTAPTDVPYIDYATAATTRNAATGTDIWLWCVPLFFGQTGFENTDAFIDLRPILYEAGVYTVTASSPLASSGGNAPNISLTGIVPIANGGTGQSTAITAFNALSPLTTKGDVLTNDNTNDIRLAVGSTNGMQLVVNSATASGLEWTAVGSTFEATLATTDATVTPLISYTVAELIGVTLQGRIIAVKTDRTAAYGASFRVSFRRATAGNVTLVGAGWLEEEDDSGGTPAVTFSVNTGTQVGIVNFAGIAAENWSIKAHYTVTSL